jgi:hypothetical protein
MGGRVVEVDQVVVVGVVVFWLVILINAVDPWPKLSMVSLLHTFVEQDVSRPRHDVLAPGWSVPAIIAEDPPVSGANVCSIVSRRECAHVVADTIQVIPERTDLRSWVVHVFCSGRLTRRNVARQVKAFEGKVDRCLRLVPETTAADREETLQLDEEDGG